jgi:hypothetical protein
MLKSLLIFIPLAALTLTLGCASLPEVKSQAYAPMKNERTYESEFPILWKAIESAARHNRVIHRDPPEATPLEMKKMPSRTLETDWIYSKSRNQYQEYQVNDFPRKVFLQNRFKYLVSANAVMGGVQVKVTTTEEVERLNANGTPHGYSVSQSPDTALAHDFLEKITLELSANPQ